jgi:uncharacterized protein
VSESGVEVVSRFSRALGAGNIDEVRSLLHDDLIVREAGGLPYSGDYYGPQGFIDLLSRMNDAFELTPGPIHRNRLDENTVLSRFALKLTARASGKWAEMNLVEIYRVLDGQIVELDVYYKDPSAVAALLAQ